jgi:hypothetical protein
VFLNNRYLDPVLGRFISVDPLISVTLDAYGYGNNNPIRFSDPSGLGPEDQGPCAQNARSAGCPGAGPAAPASMPGIPTSEDTAVRYECIQYCVTAGMENAVTAGIVAGAGGAVVLGGVYVAEMASVYYACAVACTTAGKIITDVLDPNPAAPGLVGPSAVPELRQAYIASVGKIADDVSAWRRLGVAPEFIAREAWANRRAIGIEFKGLTPEAKLAEIHARNLLKYGDKLGPTVEWLVAHGKSWEQIIESAMRTGGKDLGL